VDCGHVDSYVQAINEGCARELKLKVDEHQLEMDRNKTIHQKLTEKLTNGHALALEEQKGQHRRELELRKEAHDRTTAQRDKALEDISTVEAPLRDALNQTSDSLREVRSVSAYILAMQ
jgi:hypothetical protein